MSLPRHCYWTPGTAGLIFFFFNQWFLAGITGYAAWLNKRSEKNKNSTGKLIFHWVFLKSIFTAQWLVIRFRNKEHLWVNKDPERFLLDVSWISLLFCTLFCCFKISLMWGCPAQLPRTLKASNLWNLCSWQREWDPKPYKLNNNG